MTSDRARFEIKVNGVVRTLRDLRETAISAARSHQRRNPIANIVVTDQRDGSQIAFSSQGAPRTICEHPDHRAPHQQ